MQDNSFLQGKYSSKRKPPTTIGLEGSGIVVKNGGGWLGTIYVGLVNCKIINIIIKMSCKLYLKGFSNWHMV